MIDEVLDFFVVYGDGRKYWTAILIGRSEGQRYAGAGDTPWIAVAASLESRTRRLAEVRDVRIPPGKITCSPCRGSGQADLFVRCKVCDGLGVVWAPDGPAFGCSRTLGEQKQGAIVTLPTGHRGRVAWHCPRPSRHVRPDVTFLTLFDDFDDHESTTPTAFHSCIGVVSAAPFTLAGDIHDGEKAADAVDPIARRVLEAEGGALV